MPNETSTESNSFAGVQKARNSGMIPPDKGQPTQELWRFVRELVQFRNAIASMEVRILVDRPRTGHLVINGETSVLILE